MKIYAMTDVGRRREVNQDYVYVTERPIGPFQICLWSQTEWADIRREILRPIIP